MCVIILQNSKQQSRCFRDSRNRIKWIFIIQKAVELGVARIVPVLTKRTVVKLEDKKAAKKTERFQAIARAAAKQSGRGIVPEVTKPVSWKEALAMAETLEMNILPYEEAEGVAHSKAVFSEIKGKKSLGIFIGPEGGFSREEVTAAEEIGAETVTLDIVF